MLADAFDLAEASGFAVDDVQGLLAEFVNDAFGECRADAFDHPAGKIAPQALCRGRGYAGDGFGVELLTVSLVHHPLALGLQFFALPDRRTVPYYGHQIETPPYAGRGFDRADRVTVILIAVDNGFDGAGHDLDIGFLTVFFRVVHGFVLAKTVRRKAV